MPLKIGAWETILLFLGFRPIFRGERLDFVYMGVSKNSGTPKSSILIGFGTIINHPLWGFSLFLETPIYWRVYPELSLWQL